MHYKAIAFDVDGTIYSYEENHKGISLYTYKLLEDLKAAGYKLILCSGRTFEGIPKKLFPYFDYYVLNNGATVCDKEGNALFKRKINRNDVNLLLKYCQERKKSISIKTKDKAYFYTNNQKIPEYLYYDNESNVQIGMFDVHTTEDVYTINFDIFDNEIDILRKKYKNLIFAHGGYDYYEIYNKKADKKKGLNFILNKLNINMGECVAFGDSMNDEGMLLNVGMGVAINTGHPELLEKIKMQCNPSYKDGIRKFLLKKNVIGKERNMEIKNAEVYQEFLTGVIEGDTVQTSTKLLKDARHFYKSDDASLSDDTVMYEVYMYSKGDPKTVGNLNWGLTVIKPVYINDECNMTRGHFHEDLNCAEFYFGLAGEGLLLLMDEEYHCWAEKVSVGSVHHIPGVIAHRLINVGETEFKVGACWNTTAGHDYKRIEENPFTVRVYKRDGKIISEEE